MGSRSVGCVCNLAAKKKKKKKKKGQGQELYQQDQQERYHQSIGPEQGFQKLKNGKDSSSVLGPRKINGFGI